MVADECGRADVKRRRERWQRHQGRIDPTRLVFIDETWVKTNMAPLPGVGAERRTAARRGAFRSLEHLDLHRGARECPVFCVSARRSMLRRKDGVGHGEDNRRRDFGRAAEGLRAA